ncbi:MAG: TetR/AcrR family transcriptional regulator [Chloroflexi bacterium]|nr:TetR/AcrR family transcriptional regulator [Chloroflexota bacterium]
MKQKRTANPKRTRRDEIIQTALKMFAENGYEATTLDEVAHELGVTRPALYHHIKSKEEILQVIINRSAKMVEGLIRTGRSDLPPRQRMEALVRMLVEFPTRYSDSVRIGFEQTALVHQRTQDAFRRRQKEVERVMQQTLKEGVEQGVFAIAIDDIKMVAFAILGACTSIYHWYQPDGYLSPTQVVDHYVRFFESGYIKNPVEVGASSTGPEREGI